MEIAFIGYGKLGFPLANQIQRLGNSVTLASDDPESKSLQVALAGNPNLKVAPLKTAVSNSKVVFLAIPFAAAQSTLSALYAELNGKILVDCTNPVGPNLSHGLNSTQSAAEVFQKLIPEMQVVKAFNMQGYENITNNTFADYNIKPVMLYCGQDEAAKAIVRTLIEQLGWQPLDAGGLEQALHMEHIMLLWARMVRRNGMSPNLAWAMLTKK